MTKNLELNCDECGEKLIEIKNASKDIDGYTIECDCADKVEYERPENKNKTEKKFHFVIKENEAIKKELDAQKFRSNGNKSFDKKFLKKSKENNNSQ